MQGSYFTWDGKVKNIQFTVFKKQIICLWGAILLLVTLLWDKWITKVFTREPEQSATEPTGKLYDPEPYSVDDDH
ncbi:hypothetical protein BS639_24375 [Rouxiella silvae]|uniref:Uncharacterized protein n=1 Tax=Rouxiella silvae TaxID=1646373 RepID=A0ABX3TTR3_9GAMM|nr:hypothetical protein BS639_24375 [Rouxiella silvae]